MVFVFKGEGADGAYLDAFGALAAGCFGHGLVLEGGDYSFETPSGKANGSEAEAFLAYPYAFPAKDTLIGIVNKKGTAFIYGEVSFKSSKSFCFEFYPKMFCDFLEFTRTVF